MQQKLLEAVKVIPEDAVYRKSVEATANYRMKVAMDMAEETAIESDIGFGQIEELLEQAEEELELIDFFAANRGWDRTPDPTWYADISADIKADQAREDAEAK